MKYQINEGMQMHPFSDQSGVAFYDAQSTLVSSTTLTVKQLQTCMDNPNSLTLAQQQAIDTLLEQGFIHEVTHTL